MANNIAEDKLQEKLKYIGLNLEKIPKFLQEFTPFSFRPSKTYDDTTYKVYQYVDVTKIQILLTPTDRLSNLEEKYKKSAPLASYLDSKSEENLERYTEFLNILNNTELKDIQAIEEEQNKLKQQIPYEIKYSNNYIWQIYYSDIADQYFMLMPINEYNNVALFYLIKKQIEAKKTRRKEYIFVPISHQEYAGSYLVKSQITDLENYLWYFTKEWPNIYEVYEANKKMTLKIVGSTKVYEKLESNYVISLENKEVALETYKLIKALFIISTGLPDDYHFNIRINEKGELNFTYVTENKETNITYADLTQFIQTQVNGKKIQIGLEDKNIIEEQEKLKKMKEEAEELTEEYLSRQRQIATFLECKKTFLGKMKYFFSNRKKDFQNANKSKTLKRQVKPKEKVEEKKEEVLINSNKGPYTIEDLIEVCTKLDGRRKMVKNLKLDGKAMELKNINLKRKIKNANIYLNEIELHKKSIFEFWKFTNKDELPSLNEGEEEENIKKEKIGKTFNYETDIEEMGKQVDILQKRKFSKNETDAIFALKQVLSSFQVLNNTKSDKLTKEQKNLLHQELEQLKQNYKENIDLIKAKDFDIFGSMSEDKTKIKMLHNQKHREIEKDKYNILNITPQTEESVYIDNIRNYLNLLKEAFHKITVKNAIPVYLASINPITLENLQIFHLSEKKAIENKKKNQELYFYKLNLPENMPILYYSNIIFFDNFNKTLPDGMDLSDEIAINLDNTALQKTKEMDLNLSYLISEYTNQIIKIHVEEYDIKLKK